MNPCRQCDIFLRTGMNHSQPECDVCNKKHAYVDSMGDMTHSMPDHMTTLGGDNKGAFMADKPNIKICQDPDCEFAGEPQSILNFQKSKGGSRINTCRACISRKRKKKKSNQSKTIEGYQTTVSFNDPYAVKDNEISIHIKIRLPEGFRIGIFEAQ